MQSDSEAYDFDLQALEVLCLGLMLAFLSWGYEWTNVQSNMKEVFWNQPGLYVFDISSVQWSRQATTGNLTWPQIPFHKVQCNMRRYTKGIGR